MTTLFTQLGNNLEQIIAGVEMRRRARRNWMEQLMLEQGDSRDTTESSEAPDLKKGKNAQLNNVEQLTEPVHLGDKCH